MTTFDKGIGVKGNKKRMKCDNDDDDDNNEEKTLQRSYTDGNRCRPFCRTMAQKVWCAIL